MQGVGHAPPAAQAEPQRPTLRHAGWNAVTSPRSLRRGARNAHAHTRNTHDFLHARMRASVYHGGARAAIGAHARKQLQQVRSRTGEATSQKQPHMIFSVGFAWGDEPQNLRQRLPLETNFPSKARGVNACCTSGLSHGLRSFMRVCSHWLRPRAIVF